MNQPIRKIGMQGREAVYLLNGEQRKLHRFTPTTVSATRATRRGFLQKENNIRHFGRHVRLQHIAGKVIRHLRQPMSLER